MWKTATAMTAALMLISVAGFASGEHDPGPERSATFIGATHVEHDLNEACADAIGAEECLTRIPQGLINVVCDDHEGHPYTAGLYDGIGGAGFCLIPKGGIVTMQFVNTVSPTTPSARITCPATDPGDPDAVQWNQFITYLQGEAPVDIDVPDWCDDLPDAGVTSINVFMQAASLTQDALFLPLEGEISLSY